jgi:hypothetical protein
MMAKRRRAIQVALGLALGLLFTECGFRLRDRGAFPHINLYVPDAKLGVRLRPGASERISFSGNPVSQVRTNSAGYRGAEWPAPGGDEILVVGDSQAFGLGVNEDQTFAAELQRRTGRTVLNAGVPTYGPDEYNALLAELLPKRRPKAVVWTVNLANDLFEAAHPNTQRHAVWDGWAVRRENAPAHVAWFPGRTWLMRDSHAMFALRGLWLRFGASAGDGATASEGTWRDLASAGQDSDAHRRDEEQAALAERHRRDEKIAAMRQQIRKLNNDLYQATIKLQLDEEIGPSTLRAARANPGDIVRIYYGEGSRPIPATAEEIRQAAEVRTRVEADLRKRGEKQALAMFGRADQLDDELKRALSEAPAATLRAQSPLHAHLVKAKALCDAAGAQLVVLVLPLDVQVSAEEWKKYHAAPIDLAPTRVLATDVLATADELGARAVDAWPALAAAEPGAFLNGDLHMTEKGHRAVGAAVARALAAAGPAPSPSLPLAGRPPLGRSPVPAPAEWSSAPKLGENQGSIYDLQRPGCRVRQVREWLRVDCPGAEVTVDAAGRSEALALNTPDGASLVAAELEGDRFRAHFAWPKPRSKWQERGALISVEWALGENEPWPYASELYKPAAARPPTDAERALCECHRASGAADCRDLYGSADAACARTYAGDCRQLLRCARGDAAAPPTCAAGEQPSGATHRCAAVAVGPAPAKASATKPPAAAKGRLPAGRAR